MTLIQWDDPSQLKDEVPYRSCQGRYKDYVFSLTMSRLHGTDVLAYKGPTWHHKDTIKLAFLSDRENKSRTLQNLAGLKSQAENILVAYLEYHEDFDSKNKYPEVEWDTKDSSYGICNFLHFCLIVKNNTPSGSYYEVSYKGRHLYSRCYDKVLNLTTLKNACYERCISRSIDYILPMYLTGSDLDVDTLIFCLENMSDCQIDGFIEDLTKEIDKNECLFFKVWRFLTRKRFLSLWFTVY